MPIDTKYIVALDEGTSSCRALLVDMDCKIVDICQKEFTQHFPKSGWVEHDASEIWECQMQVFETLLSKNNLEASQILALGITNQRETTVVWDRTTGEAIHNAIVWQDRRTAPICDKLKSEGHEDYVRKTTGLVIDAYFSGTKIQWLLDNVEGARAKAESGDLCFGTIDSWLVYKLTKGERHVTDYTNASRTMLFNIQDLKWDAKMLELLNVPRSMLPAVQGSSSDFGTFTYKGVDIPICGIAGDQQSALFGQACFEKGMAKNTYGTGCFMLMNVGDEMVVSNHGLLTTLCCDAYGKVAYALEGSVFVAGAAIQWLRDGIGLIESSPASEQMAESVKDNHDLVVVPAFTGLGAPYWDMYARGAMFGLTRATTKEDIVKATVDSLGYQTKDVLTAMQKDAGIKLKKLMVDGGAVANNYLMQFQADVLQADVERPVNIETTAMGAAYLAGMYLGIWDAEKIKSNRTADRVFSPLMKPEKAEQLYGQWQKAVKRTLGWLDGDNG